MHKVKICTLGLLVMLAVLAVGCRPEGAFPAEEVEKMKEMGEVAYFRHMEGEHLEGLGWIEKVLGKDGFGYFLIENSRVAWGIADRYLISSMYYVIHHQRTDYLPILKSVQFRWWPQIEASKRGNRTMRLGVNYFLKGVERLGGGDLVYAKVEHISEDYQLMDQYYENRTAFIQPYIQKRYAGDTLWAQTLHEVNGCARVIGKVRFIGKELLLETEAVDLEACTSTHLVKVQYMVVRKGIGDYEVVF